MQKFVSKLPGPFQDLLGNDKGATAEVTEGAAQKKLSARERLDSFSNFRISPNAISITSSTSHGSGGKADVVQATFKRRQWSRKQLVAVKKLRCSAATNKQKFSNAFAHEVEMMVGLSHKNIVQLIGFVEDLDNGKAWIVLSWEANGNVCEFLAKGEWEIPERVSLIKDTLEGVKYLHTHQPPICHGDLKSFNIMVSSSYRAVITDFGSATFVDERENNTEGGGGVQENPTTPDTCSRIHIGATGNQLTLTGPAWSLRWAPPEVVNGKRPDLPSDVWAAGWVCWEIMTEKIPFPDIDSAGAITLMVIEGKVPSTREDSQLSQIVRLCSVMTDCWAFDPAKRPSITQCCHEVDWMPSVPPLGDGSSNSKVSLLLQMGHVHYLQGNNEAAASLFRQALGVAKLEGDQGSAAKALEWLGFVYELQLKNAEAEESFTLAQAIYARVGNDLGQANTLHGLGKVYRARHQWDNARDAYSRAQDIYTRIGDDSGRAAALVGLGHIYRAQTKYTEAAEFYTQAQDVCSRNANDLDSAKALQGLGDTYRAQSKYTEAEGFYTRARVTFTRIGDDLGRANVLRALGDVRRAQREYTEAEKLYTEAQEVCSRIHDIRGQANVLRGLGHLRRKQDRNIEAATFYREARDLYAQIGSASNVEKMSHCLATVSKEDLSSISTVNPSDLSTSS